MASFYRHFKNVIPGIESRPGIPDRPFYQPAIRSATMSPLNVDGRRFIAFTWNGKITMKFTIERNDSGKYLVPGGVEPMLVITSKSEGHFFDGIGWSALDLVSVDNEQDIGETAITVSGKFFYELTSHGNRVKKQKVKKFIIDREMEPSFFQPSPLEILAPAPESIIIPEIST
jgi:hypothetical protein